MYKINKTKIHLSFYFSLNMKLKPGQDVLRGVVGGWWLCSSCNDIPVRPRQDPRRDLNLFELRTRSPAPREPGESRGRCAAYSREEHCVCCSAVKRSIGFIISFHNHRLLKAPTSAFTFKTLLRHYAKRALTPW